MSCHESLPQVLCYCSVILGSTLSDLYFEKLNLLYANSTSERAVASHCGSPLSVGHRFLPQGFSLLPYMSYFFRNSLLVLCTYLF